jgi:hypothetical protein
MDLTDTYTILHPNAAKYKFFSAAHGTFFKLDHILRQKASHNSNKKFKIIFDLIRSQWNKITHQ